MDIQRIIAGASNIKGGDNPPFTMADFKSLYPHFFKPSEDDSIIPLVPFMFLEQCIILAHASVKKSRYHEAWAMCMGLYIAHFATLYMQAMARPDSGVSGAVQAGQAKGLVASKAVDGVSVSYDYSQTLADLDGWAAWKSTAFGVQLATMAKLYGMGGMYVP